MSRPNNNVRIQLDFAQKCLITESKGTKTISNEKMQKKKKKETHETVETYNLINIYLVYAWEQ